MLKILTKAKEVHSSGLLVAEIFRNYDFTVMLYRDRVCLSKPHYLYKGNDLMLYDADLKLVLKKIANWRKTRESLWGRVDSGYSCCNETITGYFPPHSNTLLMSNGRPVKPAHIGSLEKRVKQCGLEFVYERFCFEIRRENQRARFSELEVPLIEEAIELYNARKQAYGTSETASLEKLCA